VKDLSFSFFICIYIYYYSLFEGEGGKDFPLYRLIYRASRTASMASISLIRKWTAIKHCPNFQNLEIYLYFFLLLLLLLLLVVVEEVDICIEERGGGISGRNKWPIEGVIESEGVGSIGF